MKNHRLKLIFEAEDHYSVELEITKFPLQEKTEEIENKKLTLKNQNGVLKLYVDDVETPYQAIKFYRIKEEKRNQLKEAGTIDPTSPDAFQKIEDSLKPGSPYMISEEDIEEVGPPNLLTNPGFLRGFECSAYNKTLVASNT